MKHMLDARKLIASAEACLGWPYASPGTNDARGIDCSGLFVKAFRDQGGSIAHGSNTIYRKYCTEKGKLTDVSQLKPGMAVFRWNANTPEKFSDGLGDFQHIGLVTGVNPLRIVHASSAAGCVITDTKPGKWAYWGWLKDVAKPDEETEKGGETAVMPATTAVVRAESGSTVNLRTRASASAPLAERIPVGTVVVILSSGTKWSKIKHGSRTGYIMTEFLAPEHSGEKPAEEKAAEEPSLEERVSQLEQRVSLLEAH